MFDITKAVKELTDETIALRRDIHAHPELGFQEFRTSAIVEEKLKSFGLRVRKCAGTGVIGVLEGGKPGKTVMLRCELDALPVEENNDLEFCSVNPGVMHACGHDCHCACQVQIAKILSEHKEDIPGTVVFLFQPCEEVLGAPMMIEDGALTDPRPDAIFGAHVWSPLPDRKVGMVPGPDCASSYYFKITIHGKDSHGCLPHQGVSPIMCSAHVLNAIASMQAFEFGTLDEPTLITTGMIHAGNYMNNIPDKLEMEGSIRCLHESMERVHERFKEIVTDTCKANRCTCDIELTCGNNMLVNDEALYNIAHDVAIDMLGPDAVISEGVREMGGDDLAEFFREGIPGLYYLIGMANPEKGTDKPHHCKEFMVDEDVLDIMVEMQVRIVLRYLGAI